MAAYHETVWRNRCNDPLCRIFNNPEIVASGDSKDGIHLAEDAGRGVTAASISCSSRLSVSSRMSTRTGTAPRNTKAFAVERIGSQDYFVAAFDIRQQRGQIQR